MHPAVHEPVLLQETLDALAPRPGGHYVDCTVGSGGHAAALLALDASLMVTGFDRDAEALAVASARLAAFGDRVALVHADYRDLPRVLAGRRLAAVDGVLADLGLSSVQLADPARGFSFLGDGPLDMRFDRTTGSPAAALVAGADERELAEVLFRFGEERQSRRIARAIVRARREAPIATTGRLAAVVRRAAPSSRRSRLDPATRTFQAIRIWVNRELEGLSGFIGDAVRALRVGGRLAVISFHSLEDRIVKHAMRALEGRDDAADGPSVRRVTRKPVVPAAAEMARNPRARSAKLRAVERVA